MFNDLTPPTGGSPMAIYLRRLKDYIDTHLVKDIPGFKRQPCANGGVNWIPPRQVSRSAAVPSVGNQQLFRVFDETPNYLSCGESDGISSDSAGSGARAYAVMSMSGSAISSIVVSSGGSGYVNPQVFITGGTAGLLAGGGGATATVAHGVVTACPVNHGGNYQSVPLIEIVDGVPVGKPQSLQNVPYSSLDYGMTTAYTPLLLNNLTSANKRTSLLQGQAAPLNIAYNEVIYPAYLNLTPCYILANPVASEFYPLYVAWQDSNNGDRAWYKEIVVCVTDNNGVKSTNLALIRSSPVYGSPLNFTVI